MLLKLFKCFKMKKRFHRDYSAAEENSSKDDHDALVLCRQSHPLKPFFCFCMNDG